MQPYVQHGHAKLALSERTREAAGDGRQHPRRRKGPASVDWRTLFQQSHLSTVEQRLLAGFGAGLNPQAVYITAGQSSQRETKLLIRTDHKDS